MSGLIRDLDLIINIHTVYLLKQLNNLMDNKHSCYEKFTWELSTFSSYKTGVIRAIMTKMPKQLFEK